MPRSSLAVRNTVELRYVNEKTSNAYVHLVKRLSFVSQTTPSKKSQKCNAIEEKQSNTPERSNCSAYATPFGSCTTWRGHGTSFWPWLFQILFQIPECSVGYIVQRRTYANKNSYKGAGVRRRKSRKRCHHHTQRTITRLGLPAAPLTAWSTSVPGCSGTLQTFSCNLAHRCARPHRRCQHPPTPLGVEAARANVVIANIIPVRPCQ